MTLQSYLESTIRSVIDTRLQDTASARAIGNKKERLGRTDVLRLRTSISLLYLKLGKYWEETWDDGREKEKKKEKACIFFFMDILQIVLFIFWPRDIICERSELYTTVQNTEHFLIFQTFKKSDYFSRKIFIVTQRPVISNHQSSVSILCYIC